MSPFERGCGMNKELFLISIIIVQYKPHYTLEQPFNLGGSQENVSFSFRSKTGLSLRISIFTGELGAANVFCSLQLTTAGKASKRLREPKPTLRCYVGDSRKLLEAEQLLVGKTEVRLINAKVRPTPLRRRQEFLKEVCRFIYRALKSKVLSKRTMK